MIPKIIHYCWFGGAPLPPLAEKCIASWKKHCPDYEIKEWNETNYDISKNIYMKQAYENKKYGFVPDYARLDIIYNNGGVYLDTDVELIKQIDDLLCCEAFAGIENSSEKVALGLGFGAEKGATIIKELRDCYDNLLFVENGEMNLTPAPVINTAFLKEKGYVYSKEKHTFESLTIFPSEYFCPTDMKTGKINITKNTYSIHHYAASWCDRGSRIRGKIYRTVNRIFGEKVANFLKKVFGKKKK